MLFSAQECPLCRADESREVLWRAARYRIVAVQEKSWAGYCRVIWQTHVSEMTDLLPDERQELIQAVWAVERVLRVVLRPDKINLASLGNQVPHLHWHVIPRFRDDSHFPDPIWAAPRRAGVERFCDWSMVAHELAQHLK